MTVLQTVVALIYMMQLQVLKTTAALLVEWFCDNFMTLNASKCHLFVSGYKDDLIFAKVRDKLL